VVLVVNYSSGIYHTAQKKIEVSNLNSWRRKNNHCGYQLTAATNFQLLSFLDKRVVTMRSVHVIEEVMFYFSTLTIRDSLILGLFFIHFAFDWNEDYSLAFDYGSSSSVTSPDTCSTKVPTENEVEVQDLIDPWKDAIKF